MAVVFLTVVLDLVGFGLVIPLLPFFAESHRATPLQVALLMASYSLAQFVCAPLWGQLSDRVGRRPVMLASIGMTALMLAGFASASSLAMLFVFRTLHGAMTANIATAQACMADLTTPENRARGMGLIGAGFGIGFTLGPLLGGELSRVSLTAPLWLAAGLSALNFFAALAFLPETRHARSEPNARSISPVALWRALRNPVVGLCILLSFLQISAFAMMESTFTLFAERHLDMRAMDVGRVFGLVGVIGVIVQGGLIGRLVRRFGERALIPVGLGLLSAGLFAMPFVPRGLPLQLDFALVAIGHGLTGPPLFALISRSATPGEQGSVLGSAQSMSALARVIGPAAGGLLFGASEASRGSHALPFLVAAVLLAFGAALSVPATARAVAVRGNS